MEYLPITSVIYGLFLIALSMLFSKYTIGEFSTLVYGIFFIGFGIGFYLLRVGADLGLSVNNEGNWIWFFSVMFFATAVHIFFKASRIVGVRR
ncbi:MAG: hypothetical protein A3B30_03995 [Candidatus Komeilibacteria bacterium RIFCSPLOWO2_01_FULL_52_15]|uniref:Uncharacterized protein n=2 Tax=Candidatus Komeiliibacteriota TaxID=1817908 RepID=A0A1G2BQ61_9BACT|nr:MAG: hypothetical protein A2677_00695 [Candidatus Komeilibacteria bacterium RIFCSPHIGHO2_01_FULL_52_14]OGY91325.1 MAG: hypothetical protein A3B30_03995 [Candidatus Komeilibacteria bacterium RIFCSPLOWO2_01_FULL_52_15]